MEHTLLYMDLVHETSTCGLRKYKSSTEFPKAREDETHVSFVAMMYQMAAVDVGLALGVGWHERGRRGLDPV